MEYISSKANPTIKYYNSLERGKIRTRDGVFLLEGDVLVREAMAAGVSFVSVLVNQTRLDSVRDLVNVLESRGVPIYSVAPAALAHASTLDTPQSILAIGKTPKTQLTISPVGRYVVCEQIQNPGNAGAILRSAAAFNFSGVFFVGGCDIYSPKVLRGSMGAVFKVPVFTCDSPQQVAALLDQHNIQTYAAVVEDAALPITDVTFSNGSAVWIGNEGNGLSKDAVDLCSNKVYIPMQRHTESLNASVAASIFMWEMSK